MIEAVPFDASWADRWDEHVARSWNGNFLHTRRFLSYHRDRFTDASALLIDGDELLAVLPAAISRHASNTVVSHPGATYGGLVHAGLRGESMVIALQTLTRHYASRGFTRLDYKAIPSIYQRVPAQDDLYALHRLGATRHRCELSSCIDLATRPRPTKGRRSELAKARRLGITIDRDRAHLPAFWSLLTTHLQERFDAQPTHSLEEITELMDIFPDVITLHVALLGGAVTAGVVLFELSPVTHVQYIATNAEGREAGSIDLTIETAIEASRARNARYFDLGTSSIDGGKRLNDGLHAFKSSFGAGGVAHEFYEVTL